MKNMARSSAKPSFAAIRAGREIPLTVGLTGGIGAGKSEVLKRLEKKGVPVLQTDFIGHDLLKEGKIKSLLVRKLGTGILDEKGNIDRKKIGKIVFNDPRKRKFLNQTLHPLIRRKVRRWVMDHWGKKTPPPLILVEVPLLFEGKGYPYFHGVLSVSASQALRRGRLRSRGWTGDEILRRERGQWSQARKDRRADWVIRNNGTIQELRLKVDGWLARMAGRHFGQGH